MLAYKMSRGTEKFCVVCGDTAVYVNYGALTCDSCKTFFRRQNLQPKNLACNYNNRCPISLRTRKDCTKCRLAKCFMVGMTKDLIGSATNERQRKERILQMASSDPANPMDRRVALNSVPAHSYQQLQEVHEDMEQEKIDCEDDEPKIIGIVEATGSNGRNWGLRTHNFGEDQGGIWYSHLPSGQTYLRNLCPMEKKKLAEIVVAAEVMRRSIYQSEADNTKRPMLEALRLQHFGISKIVACMSSLPHFNTLEEEEKAYLLKASCAEMMILRSAMHFDLNKRCWEIESLGKLGVKVKVPLALDILGEAKEVENLSTKYLDFIRALDQRWKSDEILLTILFAIILFNPLHIISKKRRTKFERENRAYYYILKRYLETSSDTFVEATESFDRLKSVLQVLKSLKQGFESAHIQMSSQEMDYLRSQFSLMSI